MAGGSGEDDVQLVEAAEAREERPERRDDAAVARQQRQHVGVERQARASPSSERPAATARRRRRSRAARRRWRPRDDRGRPGYARRICYTSPSDRMHVLLLRPVPGNERFGLGPFFRIEPLGMEYIAAALEARGHRVTLADLRFSRSLEHQIRAARPGPRRHRRDARARNRRRRWRWRGASARSSPDVPIVVGGHTAAAYPEPFLVARRRRGRARRRRARAAARVRRARTRRAADDGAGPRAARRRRRAIAARPARPATLRAGRGAAAGAPPRRAVAPAVRVPRASAAWLSRPRAAARSAARSARSGSCTRASVRERSIDAVCRDFASVGDHVFVADDLFWHHPSRSLALAQELRRRGIRKQWILVQSRVDLVARHPELLEAWRPIAQDFDIFFGLEAATNEGLDRPDEGRDGRSDRARRRGGAPTSATASPATSSSIRRGARPTSSGCGRSSSGTSCSRPGFTILTPLPGTGVLRGDAPTAAGATLGAFRHAPSALGAGARRRAVLRAYCETWRRSVLNLRGRKSLWQWLREVDPRNALFLHPRAAGARSA